MGPWGGLEHSAGGASSTPCPCACRTMSKLVPLNSAGQRFQHAPGTRAHAAEKPKEKLLKEVKGLERRVWGETGSH